MNPRQLSEFLAEARLKRSLQLGMVRFFCHRLFYDRKMLRPGEPRPFGFAQVMRTAWQSIPTRRQKKTPPLGISGGLKFSSICHSFW